MSETSPIPRLFKDLSRLLVVKLCPGKIALVDMSLAQVILQYRPQDRIIAE